MAKTGGEAEILYITERRKKKKIIKNSATMYKIKWRKYKIRRKESKQEFNTIGWKMWCTILRDALNFERLIQRSLVW